MMDEGRDSLIYLAGTVDSDGHLTVTSINGTPQIYVKSTFKTLMEWLKDNFGGNYYPAQEATDKWKKYWRWSLSGDNAISLIQKIYPFLLLKNEVASKVLEFQLEKIPNVPMYGEKFGRFGKPTKEEIERRKKILEEIRILNKRGRGG